MRIDIREQASDNLRFIRGVMERAERMSSASGIAAMIMGAEAFAAMLVAQGLQHPQQQLRVWIVAAFVALLTGVLGSWWKARRNDLPLLVDPARRFLLCLIPALLVGVVLTLALWRTSELTLLPSIWMMLYGAGVLAAGTYTVPPVVRMGAVFLLAGLITQLLPPAWGNAALGLVFGGAHVYFGWQVFRNHGG